MEKEINRPDDTEPIEERTRGHISPAIELIRVIDRTIHISPISRKKQVDYTIRNPSDSEFNFVFIPLRKFERNLQAYDETGIQLNIYPNKEVRAILDRVKEHDSDAYNEIMDRLGDDGYMLYIQLPPDRPLEAGEMRTVQLTFQESSDITYKGGIGQWEKKFFNIPSFFADIERYHKDPHDVFVTVIGPPGERIRGKTEYEGDIPEKGVYENGLQDNARVISIRLPPHEDGDYKCMLEYDLIPPNRIFRGMLAMYWVIALIVGLASVAFPIFEIANEPFGLGIPNTLDWIPDIGRALTAGFITATLGLIFALDMDWTYRYRLLSVIPLLPHGIGWIMWTIVQ